MSEKTTTQELADLLAEEVRHLILKCAHFESNTAPQFRDEPAKFTLTITAELDQLQLAEWRQWQADHVKGCVECQRSEASSIGAN